MIPNVYGDHGERLLYFDYPDAGNMLTDEEINKIHELAYLPEHSVCLMASVSGAAPFLFKDYLCLAKGSHLIIVGYPLERRFDKSDFNDDLDVIKKEWSPERISLIAPELPKEIESSCHTQEEDHYFTMACRPIGDLRPGLIKKAHEAEKGLKITYDGRFTDDHREITHEFMERIKPKDRIRRLYNKIPDFLESCEESLLIGARDKRGRLTAYYVVDLAPRDFSTYVVGCHSKKNYVPGASDALFLRMMEASFKAGKKYLHLGLGVNKGVRQFKKKWGGKPDTPFYRCEMFHGRRRFINTFLSLLKYK